MEAVYSFAVSNYRGSGVELISVNVLFRQVRKLKRLGNQGQLNPKYFIQNRENKYMRGLELCCPGLISMSGAV